MIATPFLAYGDSLPLLRASQFATAYAAVRRAAADKGIARGALRLVITAPGILRIEAGAHCWVIRRERKPILVERPPS